MIKLSLLSILHPETAYAPPAQKRNVLYPADHAESPDLRLYTVYTYTVHATQDTPMYAITYFTTLTLTYSLMYSGHWTDVLM